MVHEFSFYRHDCYNDDLKTPVYTREKDVFTPKQTVELLLNSEKYVDRREICTAQPLRVQHNCTFIVDLSKLKDTQDVKCDDLGSWKNNGSKKFCFHVHDEDGFLFAKSVTDDEENNLTLRREYFQLRNLTTGDFRKRIDTIISKYVLHFLTTEVVKVKFIVPRTCFLTT